MTNRLSLSVLGSVVTFGPFLAACATVATFPAITDGMVQRLVDDHAQRVLRVSENKDIAHLYQFKLADLKSRGAAGISVGDHVIYIDHTLASQAERDPRYRDLIFMVIAHEVAHDVLTHVANQQALALGFTVAQQAARVGSYVPGPVGWAAAGASWLMWGAQKATGELYGRAQELAADQKAIAYWKQMGLDCSVWVKRFQALADKGIKGDFRHPTEGRLEQAKELCPAGASPPSTASPAAPELPQRVPIPADVNQPPAWCREPNTTWTGYACIFR